MQIIVRTRCTATVEEEWTFDVPDGADVNQQSFEGSGGWGEAIESSRVTIVSCVDEKVYDEVDRTVTEVRVAQPA